MEDADRLGFMPRKRSFAFLNAARLTTPAAFIHTAAHELGHGAFHLQHIFDRFPDLRPGATNNLMDYGDSTTLYKYQWDNIHDPESNFALFDEEGEGALEGGAAPAVASNLPCIVPERTTLLTPDLLGITLPVRSNVDFNDNGILRNMQVSNDVYTWSAVYNGTEANGYRRTGSDVSYDSGIDYTEAIPRPFLMGKKTLEADKCWCRLYSFEGNMSVASNGVFRQGLDYVSLTERPLFSASQGVHSETLAHPSHCDPGETSGLAYLNTIFWESYVANGGNRQAKRINSTPNLLPYIQQAKTFFEANNYRIAIFFYDHGNNETVQDDQLSIYRPNKAVASYTDSEQIRQELVKFHAGNYGEGIDIALLVDKFSDGNDIRSRSYLGVKDSYFEPLADVPANMAGEYPGQALSSIPNNKLGTAAQYKKDIQQLVQEVFDNSGNLEQSFGGQSTQQSAEADGNFKVVGTTNFFKWAGFASSELGHLIRKGEVSAGLWLPTEATYGEKPLNIYSPVAATVDEGLRSVKDLYETVGLVKEIVKDPIPTVTQLYNHFAGMSASQLLYTFLLEDHDQYRTNYLAANTAVEKQYCGTRATIHLVVVGAQAALGSSLLLTVLDNSGKKVAVLKKIDELDLPDSPRNPIFEQRLQALDDVKTQQFLDDVNAMGGQNDSQLEGVVRQFNEQPGMVESWQRMGDHPNKRNFNIVNSRRAFDDVDASYAKNNPFTGSEMFDMETGGFVTVHPQHNVNLNDLGHRAEFTVSESWARSGKRVTLLDESDAMGVGVARPDAFVEGIGTFDVKNIDVSAQTGSLRTNIRDKILATNRQADNIAINAGDNPNVTPAIFNQAVADAIQTADQNSTSLPLHISLTYPNGTSKILSVQQFRNGVQF